MSVVYLLDKAGENIIAFDATTTVTYNKNATLTKSSVMSGAQISDGYTIGNDVVTFSGVISYSKIRDFAPNPRQLEERVNELINSYTRFKLYGNDIIPTLDDCVITNFSLTQDNYSNAATGTISIEKVFVSDQAEKTTIILPKPSVSTQGQLAPEVSGGNGSKTQNTEEQSRTMYEIFRESGSSVAEILIGRGLN